MQPIIPTIGKKVGRHTYQAFFNAMQSICTVRRFYFTVKWRIAVGSRLLGPGDKAYLLLQARSLFTLRACKAGNPKARFSTDIVLLGYAYVIATSICIVCGSNGSNAANEALTVFFGHSSLATFFSFAARSRLWKLLKRLTSMLNA